MSEPRDVLRDHIFDGIQEYDNALPRWWLGILWGTIAFSAVFTPWLHLSGWSQDEQYDDEVASAAKVWPESLVDTAAAPAAPTPELAAAGKAIFAATCVPCHGAEARGGIGPDLTDAQWVHGGTFAEILNTVIHGVPDKGMLPWGPALGPEKCSQVAAYVHGLGGGR